MTSSNSTYINRLEIHSNDFCINSDADYQELNSLLKSKSDDLLNIALKIRGIGKYCINLSFDPQAYYNKNKSNYWNIVDYNKILKCHGRIQKIVGSIDFNQFGISICELKDWKLSNIEISRDINLDIQYPSYIATIRAIKSSRQGCYSKLIDYNNGDTICFRSGLDNDLIAYTSHVRFENKIKKAKQQAKDDKELAEQKESILQCTLMIPFSRIQPAKFAVPDFGEIFIDYYTSSGIVRLNDIIADYENSLDKCGSFFDKLLIKYLFNSPLELHEELKDDSKLLDKIRQDIKGDTERHILYFIIIMLLSELSRLTNFQIKKIANFLEYHSNEHFRKKSKKALSNIDQYRNNYRKNYMRYTTQDLFEEIKGKLLAPSGT